MRTVVSVSSVLLAMLVAAPASAKPISDDAPALVNISSDDVSGPALRLTLSGISADFVRGDVRVTAEITIAVKARVYVVYKKFHFTVESDLTRWKVAIAFGSWFPLTNLSRLEAEIQHGMQGVHEVVEAIPGLLDMGESTKTRKRLRPWARPLRLAGDALDSVWNAKPGWTIGILAIGRVMDPLGLRLDPPFEISATATLIF